MGGQVPSQASKHPMWSTSVLMRKYSRTLDTIHIQLSITVVLDCSGFNYAIFFCSPTIPVTLNMRMSMPAWWVNKDCFCTWIILEFSPRIDSVKCLSYRCLWIVRLQEARSSVNMWGFLPALLAGSTFIAWTTTRTRTHRVSKERQKIVSLVWI